MSLIPRFASYAAAFEEAYKSDDWAPIGPYFADDAVYEIPGMPAPIGGRFAGRAAILAYFKRVLDSFDRRFATRSLALIDGPREDGDTVWLRGSGVYTAPGLPDFRFELEEIATFRGDRICHLEDRYDDANAKAFAAYANEHGAALGLASS